MTDALRGVIAPLLTPFAADGTPDAGRFVAHGRGLLAAGCHALAPFGTTGEANSLSLGERTRLLDAALDAGLPPHQLLPGTGTCALPDTVDLTRRAVASGCAGVLLLPPFYYKNVSDDALFACIAEVIERVGDRRLRIYLYHIPPQAVLGYSVDLVVRLRDAFAEVVVGLKDSSGDWSNTRALLEACPDLAIFSGSEVSLLDNLRAGGAGCITATANANAAAIRAVFDHWQSADAESLQAGISATRKLIQSQPMIPMLKHIVAAANGDESWLRVRPPLLALAASEAAGVLERLREAQAA